MFLLGLLALTFLNTVCAQIRFHEPHQNRKFNYSYINVRHVKGYKLTGANPISTVSTRNRTECHRACVKEIGACKSINVAETTNGFECETLPIDIYTEGVLVADASSTHYIIGVNI